MGRDPEEFGAVPEHVRLLNEWVPQDVLLEAADVFITHGGHSSIREGLRSGTPMLVTPMYDDQPNSAEHVAEVGSGINLPAYWVTGETVTEALAGCSPSPRSSCAPPPCGARSSPARRWNSWSPTSKNS